MEKKDQPRGAISHELRHELWVGLASINRSRQPKLNETNTAPRVSSIIKKSLKALRSVVIHHQNEGRPLSPEWLEKAANHLQELNSPRSPKIELKVEPPLGVTSRRRWEENLAEKQTATAEPHEAKRELQKIFEMRKRMFDLIQAMDRYRLSKLTVPSEWLQEATEHLQAIHVPTEKIKELLARFQPSK